MKKLFKITIRSHPDGVAAARKIGVSPMIYPAVCYKGCHHVKYGGGDLSKGDLVSYSIAWFPTKALEAEAILESDCEEITEEQADTLGREWDDSCPTKIAVENVNAVKSVVEKIKNNEKVTKAEIAIIDPDDSTPGINQRTFKVSDFVNLN